MGLLVSTNLVWKLVWFLASRMLAGAPPSLVMDVGWENDRKFGLLVAFPSFTRSLVLRLMSYASWRSAPP